MEVDVGASRVGRLFGPGGLMEVWPNAHKIPSNPVEVHPLAKCICMLVCVQGGNLGQWSLGQGRFAHEMHNLAVNWVLLEPVGRSNYPGGALHRLNPVF